MLRWAVAAVVLAASMEVAAQMLQDDLLKSSVHAQAQEKVARDRAAKIGAPAPASSSSSLGMATENDKCCTVAMFLGSIALPSGGEALKLGDAALNCCRRMICPRFQTQEECLWISSGDTSWRDRLGEDLDRVQSIENRLNQISNDDLQDPTALGELKILKEERDRIEDREMKQLTKVAPLTAMCDDVLDSDLPAEDLQEEQEARVQCISSFVDIAYGSCGWLPAKGGCVSVVDPATSHSGSWGSTLAITLVIGSILGVTWYVARPAAGVSEVERGEYSSLEQLPSDLMGTK